MAIGLRRTVLFLSDVTALALAAGVTYALCAPESMAVMGSYYKTEVTRLVLIHVMMSFACLSYFSHKGHYTWRSPWWQQVRQVLRLAVILCFVSLLVTVITAPDGVLNFYWIPMYWGLGSLLLLTFRWVGRAFLKRHQHWDIPTVLIGGSSNVAETIFALRSELFLSYQIQKIVLLDYTPEKAQEIHTLFGDIPVTGEMGEICHRSMVILCPDQYSEEFMRDTVAQIRAVGARFAISPPTGGFSFYGLQTQSFFGHRIVLLESRIRIRTLWGRVSKMAMDKVGAVVALILFSPLFVILALKIRKDGGPVFYAQTRIGKDGQKFKCLKFRSMIHNADKVLQDYLDSNPEAKAEYARDFKLKNDPRITPVGHILRRTSLDEIPQFINVLKGDMSLVGPRPVVEAETAYYGDKLGHYLSVRPGVTGLWQVSGRNDVSYDQRVALDVWYVENWSLWNDIVIILKTIYVVSVRKGAY